MRVSRLFALLLLSFTAHAQSPAELAPRRSDPFAAIVNDDTITHRELDQRTKLALLSSNLPDTPEMRKKVLDPLLRRLIDEDLKIQAATKEKVGVSPEQITAQMSAIELQNHMAVGGLAKYLASHEVDPEALKQQIRADLTWSWLRHHVLMQQVHVSESAVTTRLDAIRANLGKPEYLVSEIYLNVEDEKQEGAVKDLAERIIEQVRQGAPFDAIARQFNQSGAADGDLGWVSDGMLDDELMAALNGLQPKQVTPAIRTLDGYHILSVREVRKVGDGFGNGPTVDLMTIDLNSIATAGPAERDLQRRHLRDLLAPAKSCEDLTRLSKQAPSAAVNIVEKLPESQLPLDVRPLIKDLAPGQVSQPLDTPKGRRFFAVCGRAAGKTGELPSADDIRHRMEDEQLELVARRYMIDLRRHAIIEIRL
jgi:peptidyl-prolyl cis-trans isomerase SurA